MYIHLFLITAWESVVSAFGVFVFLFHNYLRFSVVSGFSFLEQQIYILLGNFIYLV